MKYGIRFVCLLCLLLSLALTASIAAQDELTVVVELTDGYSISVPDGWSGSPGLNDGFIISDGTRFLYVMDPTVVSEALDLEDDAPPLTELLINLFELQYRVAPDLEDITQSELGEPALAAAVHTYSVGDAFAGTYVVVQVGELSWALFDMTAPVDDTLDALELIGQIAATLVEGEIAPITAAATAVPCMVVPAPNNTVAVRIGPGDNRAIILYMPNDTEVRANGVFIDENGAEWLRVNKTQLAPDVAADELWVLAEEVITSGDCTNLTAIASRNIIPAAPPVVVIASEDTAQGANTSAGVPTDPNAALGLVPRGGMWTWRFDSTAYQSCAAGGATGDTTQSPTSELLGTFASGFTSAMNVAADGRSFTFYGTTYTLQSGGIYLGVSDFGGGVGQATRLRVISDSRMTGEYTINVQGADFACSITIYVTVTRG
ncbi:MAG: hypothetical protein SF123_16955 [Chloroflexota bacterium]|nr:hypothetical protein [Chloroflexota bacterium]